MTLGTAAPYFFTATMNGCAFKVTGNPQNPTVSHLNTTQPADTVPGAVVDKGVIKARYAAAIGDGGPNDAVLTKYKGPADFGGHNERYKLQPAELAAIHDPNLAPNAMAAADLNTFVVGVYDALAGWQFFYQRNAVLLTRVRRATLMAGDYHASGPIQWARKKMGKEHGFRFGVESTDTDDNTPLNHTVTACRRLQFP